MYVVYSDVFYVKCRIARAADWPENNRGSHVSHVWRYQRDVSHVWRHLWRHNGDRDRGLLVAMLPYDWMRALYFVFR